MRCVAAIWGGLAYGSGPREGTSSPREKYWGSSPPALHKVPNGWNLPNRTGLMRQGAPGTALVPNPSRQGQQCGADMPPGNGSGRRHLLQTLHATITASNKVSVQVVLQSCYVNVGRSMHDAIITEFST